MAGLIIYGLYLVSIEHIEDYHTILMIPVVILSGIATFLFFYFRDKKEEEKAKAYNAELRKNYQKTLDQANTLNQKNQETFARDYPLWQKSTDENRAVLQKPLAESQALLEKLYSSDVIFPKYRNLPALTSISEYLITGRCDSLTGPHGAYNLYEEEIRQNTVIAQLNVVIRNLEQIKQNQYLLYEQVSQINRVAQGVYSELRQIKNYSASIAASSALTAYYAGRNERHNRISMYCDLLD